MRTNCVKRSIVILSSIVSVPLSPAGVDRGHHLAEDPRNRLCDHRHLRSGGDELMTGGHVSQQHRWK